MSRRERQYAKKAAQEEEEVARTGVVAQGRLKSWRLVEASKSGALADDAGSGLGLVSGPAVTSVDGDKPLYVDVLPFASTFLSEAENWDLTRLKQKVQLFVDAARQTGFSDVTAFIRSSNYEEGDALWRKRKEKEVKDGVCEIPGLSILLGEAFEDAGASCQYSSEGVSFLETLASHADYDGADILSVSRDLLLFKAKRYSLFKNFEVRGGERLALEVCEDTSSASGGSGNAGAGGAASAKGGSAVKAPKSSSLSSSYELALPPPPTVEGELNLDSSIALGLYIRPAPTPLVRDLGANPYVTARDLRRSLYGLVMFGSASAAPGSTGRMSTDGTSGGSGSSASSGAGSGHSSPVLFSSIATSGIREEFPVWDAEKGCAVFEVTDGVKPLDDRSANPSPNPNYNGGGGSSVVGDARSRAASALSAASSSGGRSPLVRSQSTSSMASGPASVRALLLGDPFVAFKEFFPEEAEAQEHAMKVGSKLPQRPASRMATISEKAWKKHVFGCCEVVAELHAIATSKRLLDVMLAMGF